MFIYIYIYWPFTGYIRVQLGYYPGYPCTVGSLEWHTPHQPRYSGARRGRVVSHLH